MQGKVQADAIRQTILQTQKVPWQVVTANALSALQAKALNPDKKDKEARLLLFEYALYYQHNGLLNALIRIGFAPAQRIDKKSFDLLERKYFFAYSSSNTTHVLRLVDQYGIDFRTVFNQTPLMVASYFGNSVLVDQLLAKGANSAI